jgi:type I restriction enzyme, R subunit
LTPEARARQSIDVLLVAAGRAVQDLKQANIHAALGVVIREFQLSVQHGILRCAGAKA